MTQASATQAFHDYTNVFPKTEKRLTELLEPRTPTAWRLLDIGCGYHYPMIALFYQRVAELHGVDVERVFYREGRSKTLRIRLREVGLLRAVKWATIRYSYYKAYFDALEALAYRTFPHHELPISTYDGLRLPFATEHFDAVISTAVLEHVMDLDLFVDEVARVLRHDGVIDMLWHNFYSPSGSHLAENIFTANPWGHVTGELATTGLNKKTPTEIERSFKRRFEIVRLVGADREHRLLGEDNFVFEGRESLSDEWLSQLQGIPEELLVTRSFLIQAKKSL